ncbi:MAG: hypothetical protein HY321_15475 [Armatimonadetes bacterium]|nr:hypothetical protein [Armatimonadota bacterium]
MKRIFAWAAAARLPGEGMQPLSNPTHHRITQAAIERLPAPDREFLAAEADLLIWTYCGFPDLNWHWYGTFAQDPSAPADRRLPDVRREWEIPRYCRWNSLTREGRWYPHWPPDAIEAAAAHFAAAWQSLAAGSYHDAVRTLGACLHYAQDTGSPSHAGHVDGPLHLPMERMDQREIQQAIGDLDHTPVLLGPTLESALAGIRASGTRLYAFAASTADPIRHLCEDDRQAEAQWLMLPCAHECVRYTADILRTFCALARHRRPPDAAPEAGINLLPNGDLSEPDDVPEAARSWHVHWNDLFDREGRSERVAVDGGYALSIAAAAGPGIQWRTSWPAGPRVRPGMRLRLRLRYRTEGLPSGCRPALRFYTANTTPAGIATVGFLPRAAHWTPCEVTAEVPGSACWARVSLEAAACPGRVFYRDVSLEQVG